MGQEAAGRPGVCVVVVEVAWFGQEVFLGLGLRSGRKAAPIWLGRQAAEDWAMWMPMEIALEYTLSAI